MTLDRFEKLGRLVLWLSLSSAVIIAPITYLKLQAAESEWRESAKKADAEEAAKKVQADLDERSGKTRRLSLATMGEFLASLGATQGQIVFTNVSSRGGVLCVYGTATNRTTGKSTTSIAACKEIAPYASTVEIAMMFAGGEMSTVCPNSSCQIVVHDAPEAQGTAWVDASPKAPAVAVAAPPPAASP